MKLLFPLLISTLIIFVSCSKSEDAKNQKKSSNKPKVVSKHKNMQPQEPPPREIIDINEEGYSVDEVLKIDKEIPVLEIICGKDWKQSDINKLSTLQMVDTIRLENMNAETLDLSSFKSIKSLKVVSLKGSKVSIKTLKSLSDSTITELDCTKTNLSDDEIKSLSSILPKAKIAM